MTMRRAVRAMASARRAQFMRDRHIAGLPLCLPGNVGTVRLEIPRIAPGL